MKLAPTLLCFGLLLCPGTARADMLFPGMKRCETRVAIDNLDDYPEYVFYFVPAGWWAPGQQKPGNSWNTEPSEVHLRSGEAHKLGYAARMFSEWTVIAVPRSHEPTSRAEFEAIATGARGAQCSNRVNVEEVGTTIVLNPLNHETNRFRVTLTADGFTLTPVSVRPGVSFLSVLPGLFLTAAFTGLGYWVVRRRRRKRVALTQPTAAAK